MVQARDLSGNGLYPTKQSEQPIDRLSGTFTGTGTTDWITIGKDQIGLLQLVFAGTATIKLERRSIHDDVVTDEGTVRTYTASVEDNIAGAKDAQFRLNCTAHTNNVDYVIG